MNRPFELCIVTTHPIQYMVPWFRELAATAGLSIEVIFFREPDARQQGVGFDQAFQWDVPLREGYRNSVLDAPMGAAHLPKLLRRLRTAVARCKRDAVLITGWNEPGLIAAYPLMRQMRIPVLVRGDSNALRDRPWWKSLLHRLWLRGVAGALTVGKANHAFYLHGGMPAQKLFPGAHFVETTRMLEMAASHGPGRAALRADLGISEGDFVFCFVGKHVAFKRPELLVESAAILLRQGWPVKLLFAGSGALTPKLRESAERLRVPCVFCGFLNQSQLWRAYVPADALVLPSTHQETWGLVTNEAMLFGLPVIVSDQVGCGPDLVVEGQTGHVFSGGAQALAEAMELLLQDPQRARQMGRRGRQRIIDEFSTSAATAGLLQALRAVTTGLQCDDGRHPSSERGGT